MAQSNYSTLRLLLNELTLRDSEFISELVNTPEWIKFIGDRNVKTKEDALGYVQKLIDNPDIHYWVVRLRNQQTPMGVITFCKRDYLNHPDIGFAFLGRYTKQGYAYEAAAAVLGDVLKDVKHTCILATTLRENANSIQLLGKLGFRFHNEIKKENERVLVYSIATDKSLIDTVTKTFFTVFTNANKQQVDWNLIYSLCFPAALLIKKNDLAETVYDLNTFIEPRKKILSDGTLKEFEENEITEETKITGNIAQRFSRYHKCGYLNGNYFKEYGNKLFQFVKTADGWKINSLVWEDDKI